MGEVNFGKKATDAATPVAEHVVKPVEPAAPVVGASVAGPSCGVPATVQPQGGLVLGDKLPTFNEIILPRLNLVQNSGNLKDSFQPGAIVYNQTTVLYTPPVINKQTQTFEKAGTAPLVATVLGFRPTRFVEKVPGGGRGMLCTTEEQVRQNGGTLDYNEWRLKASSGMKRFEYMADALVAIQRPEIVSDDDTVFVYPVEEKKYALAIWSLKGSAYTAACKRVFFTARSMGCLKGGYPTYSYNITTRSEPTPDKTSTYFIPVCLPNKKSTPEFLNWVATVLQPERAPEAAE